MASAVVQEMQRQNENISVLQNQVVAACPNTLNKEENNSNSRVFLWTLSLVLCGFVCYVVYQQYQEAEQTSQTSHRYKNTTNAMERFLELQKKSGEKGKAMKRKYGKPPPEHLIVGSPTQPELASDSAAESVEKEKEKGTTTRKVELHPLQKVKLSKSLFPKRTRKTVNRGTKRGRLGARAQSAELGLEDYDMTDEFPYDDIKVFDVYPDGDCLFHCARKVLHDLSIEVSIRDLRSIVARSVGEKEFTMLQNIYTMAVRAGDVELMQDYRFMHNVASVPALRHTIMTPSYFGDEMALRAIEAAYPVKFMVIRMAGENKIELSRRFSDEEACEKPWFAMLLLNLRAVHYELISFKDKAVMRRNELPNKIQRLIKQCEKERELRKQKEENGTDEKKKNTTVQQQKPLTPAEKLVRAGPLLM